MMNMNAQNIQEQEFLSDISPFLNNGNIDDVVEDVKSHAKERPEHVWLLALCFLFGVEPEKREDAPLPPALPAATAAADTANAAPAAANTANAAPPAADTANAAPADTQILTQDAPQTGVNTELRVPVNRAQATKLLEAFKPPEFDGRKEGIPEEKRREEKKINAEGSLLYNLLQKEGARIGNSGKKNSIELDGLVNSRSSLSTLAGILKKCPWIRYETLSLKNNNIDDEGIKSLEEALRHNTALTELNLSGNRIKSGGAIGGIVIDHILQTLNISDNQIGDDELELIIRPMIQKNTVTNLDLAKNGIKMGDAKWGSIMNDLLKGVRIEDPGKIATLNLSDNELGNNGLGWILPPLEDNSTLKQLYISKNRITKNGGDCVRSILMGKNIIELLDLSRNNLEDYGASKCAESLKSNTALTILDLRYNGIREEGRRTIDSCMLSNTTLTSLCISDADNDDIGELKDLMEELKNGTETTVNFSNKWMTCGGARKIADALKENTTVTSLDLSCNFIGDSGAKYISEVLKKNKTLKFLDLGWNEISQKGLGYINKALKNNTTLVELYLYMNTGIEGLSALKESLNNSSHLRTLSLGTKSEVKLSDSDATALCEVLEKNSSIERLDLNGNWWLDDSTIPEDERCFERKNTFMTGIPLPVTRKRIKDAFQKNSTITHLDLHGCKIKTGCVLSAALTNTTITFLDLRGNELKFEGAKTIGRLLGNNSTLTTLLLGKNSIDLTGVKELCTGLKNNTSLTDLDLHFNDFCFSSHSDEKESIMIKNEIGDALQKNSTVTCLNLHGCRINKNGILFLKSQLEKNKGIRSLNLHGNKFGEPEAIDFCRSLEANTSLSCLDIQDNGIRCEWLQEFQSSNARCELLCLCREFKEASCKTAQGKETMSLGKCPYCGTEFYRGSLSNHLHDCKEEKKTLCSLMHLSFGGILGSGGEASVFSVSDEDNRTGKDLVIKMFERDFGKTYIKSLQSIEKVYANLNDVMHESDPGTGHLVPALIIFDISPCFGYEEVDDNSDSWIKKILQPSCREGFTLRTSGDRQNKDKVVEIQSLVDHQRTYKHFYPLAIVMEKYDGSLGDVLTKKKGCEKARAQLSKYPWLVMHQSLNGILMMMEAFGSGHGDFKPANILYKYEHGAVVWTTSDIGQSFATPMYALPNMKEVKARIKKQYKEEEEIQDRVVKQYRDKGGIDHTFKEILARRLLKDYEYPGDLEQTTYPSVFDKVLSKALDPEKGLLSFCLDADKCVWENDCSVFSMRDRVSVPVATKTANTTTVTGDTDSSISSGESESSSQKTIDVRSGPEASEFDTGVSEQRRKETISPGDEPASYETGFEGSTEEIPEVTSISQNSPEQSNDDKNSVEAFSHSQGDDEISVEPFSHSQGDDEISVEAFSHSQGDEELSVEAFSHSQGDEEISVEAFSHSQEDDEISAFSPSQGYSAEKSKDDDPEALPHSEGDEISIEALPHSRGDDGSTSHSRGDSDSNPLVEGERDEISVEAFSYSDSSRPSIPLTQESNEDIEAFSHSDSSKSSVDEISAEEFSHSERDCDSRPSIPVTQGSNEDIEAFSHSDSSKSSVDEISAEEFSHSERDCDSRPSIPLSQESNEDIEAFSHSDSSKSSVDEISAEEFSHSERDCGARPSIPVTQGSNEEIEAFSHSDSSKSSVDDTEAFSHSQGDD